MKINLLKLMGVATLLGVSLSVGAQNSEKSATVYLLEDEACFGGSIQGVSPNGKYAVGFSETFSGNAYLWEKETGKVTVLTGCVEDNAEAYNVSNDGTVVGCFKDPYSLDKNGTPCLVPGYWKDGEWTKLETVKGLPFAGGGMDGAATAISADGKIISGYVRKEAGVNSPAIWIDGKLQPFFEGELQGQGALSWAMSDDGSVLAGWAEHPEGPRSPAVWVNGEMTRIAGETFDNEVDEYFFFGDVGDVSRNGKYVVGYFAPEDQIPIPFIWSEEKGRVDFASSGMGCTVSNEGTVLGTSGYEGEAFIYKDEKLQTLQSHLEDNYNYTGEGFCTPLGCSDDGKVIGGWNLKPIQGMEPVMQPFIIVLKDGTENIQETQLAKLGVEVNNHSLTFTQEVKEFAIADAAGKNIYPLTSLNGSTWNAGQLANGIYLITLSDGNGTNHTQKIIIR